MKNIILIGLGPHARGAYYPILEKYRQEFNICIPLIIDLKNQSKQICQFLTKKFLQPDKLLFLEATKTNILGQSLDPLAKKTLDTIVNRIKIDGVIIVTEPKAHKIYIEWAAKHKINVLTEKPLTSPVNACVNKKSAQKVFKDYVEIMRIIRNSGILCYTMIQKRNGQAYHDIWNYLNNFVKKYQIPISYFEAYFADGTWVLPTELEKENHPYKYGYGKLMHSGYHYVDLFSWMTAINDQIVDKKPNKVRLYVNQFTVRDFLHQINAGDYEKMFGKVKKISQFFSQYKHNKYQNYGELDVFVLIQMLRDNIIINTSSITMQQNSFSRRSWLDYPNDPYKYYGRLRHERLNIQVSNLLNIQLHSYQSYDNRHDNEAKNFEDVGQKEHQEVYIFRNADIVGGKPFEKYNYGEILSQRIKQGKSYLSHNDMAKKNTIYKFLRKEKDSTQLENQETSMKIFSKICEVLALNHQGKIPYIEFNI